MIIGVAVPDRLRARFFEPATWQRLESLGRLVLDRPFPDLVADADVAVTSWGCPRLTLDVLRAAPRLRLLAHTGASVHALVSPESFAAGVRVTQSGAAMAYPVAETALGMTLALLHRPPCRHELRAATIGVVGASRTGREYIRLVRQFGAQVLVHDPYIDDGVDLDTVLAGSRVVALHAPLLPSTRGMIGARELALLPDGAGLVNTARSGLIDTPALLAELTSGRINAALDVFDVEPLPDDDPLRAMPNVLLSPHVAADTVEGYFAIGALVVDEIERFVAGRPLQHEITEPMLERMG